MKRMTDSEKIAVIASAINNAFATQDIAAIIDCPYGEPSHGTAGGCRSCSKLDGSECVDELLEAIDAFELDGVRIDSAIQRVRAWRAKR
jgi:hypothetical protein